MDALKKSNLNSNYCIFVDMLKYHRFNGKEARSFAKELASLRLRVFFDFPYLYEGNEEYEMKYLETYFRAQHSFLFLVEENQKIVGASTGIWAQEEEESFRTPFILNGMNPENIFYFGESVLLPEYRGRGLGKIFFEEREHFAKSLSFIQTLSFCAVERSDSHPLKPNNYRPLNSFWESLGFQKENKLKTEYEWQDRGEKQATKKTMQYWIKHLK